jgi:hypothetical protein
MYQQTDVAMNVYDSWEGCLPPDIPMLKYKCLTGVRPAREYQDWAGFDDPPAAVRYQEWTGFNDPPAAGPARKYQEWTGFDDPPEGPRVQNLFTSTPKCGTTLPFFPQSFLLSGRR